VEIRLLGHVEVTVDDEPLPLPAAKPRALLAMLALGAGAPVSFNRLIDGLWGERPPASAHKLVQLYVSQLRKLLTTSAIITRDNGYELRVPPESVDALRFERLVATAESRAVQEALALWRAPPLEGLADQPFAAVEIRRLEHLHARARELAIEDALASGGAADHVDELQELVAAHPLRERLRGQLMLALYRSGRQAEALEAFLDARRVLVDELGIEPGRELRELHQAILAQDPALDGPPATGVGSPERERLAREPSAGVPRPPTRTVGRDADLRRVREALEDARLVTITGPGGVGKTRLAIEVARASDKAAFVSLAAIAAAEDVAAAIVRALKLEPLPGEPPDAALLRVLPGRGLLLVLDNFEHVLDAAELVSRLVAADPGVSVLATSREPLRVRAERVLRLAPLTPEAAVEQFELLLAARDQRVGDAAAAHEICRRLDGLPLAIELAAGRVGLLSVEELALRLRTDLTALSVGARDAPARQRTLAATLAWSYDLARPAERAALAALSVFAGGCTLDAAEQVTAAPLAVLDALVTKNLAIARDGRVWLLETIRAFARERLADGAVRRRHAEYYAALAERSRPELDRTGAVELLDPEIDNFRGALQWTLDHGAPELALRLASALTPFWLVRRHLSGEAVRWLTAGLDAGPVPPALRARALTALARHLPDVQRVAEAEEAGRESLALRRMLGDTAGCAESLCALAHIQLSQHHVEQAYALAAEAERLATGAQTALEAQQILAVMAPTLDEALARGERVLTELRGAGNRRRYAAIAASLAYTALFHDEPATARRLSERALAEADPDDRFATALAEGNAGLAALFEGDLARARSALAHALRVGAGDHYPGLVAEAVYGLAAVAAVEGHDEQAAELWGAVQRLDETGADPLIAARIEARFFDPARARLGEDAWHVASLRLGCDAAIEAAIDLHGPDAPADA